VTVQELVYRDEPRLADRERVREIVERTGFFSEEECRVAVELLDDRLQNGPASEFTFLFAEQDASVVGYTCFGRIALTRASYDLYWIAVDPDAQGHGIGRELMAESERRVAAEGGERVYVETSSRAQYLPTRAFYERCDYRIAATLEDFYAPGDGKVIFVKQVSGARAG
jgi:ribosomal protein S18 acetylase RimI-like enzyme